ncbi:DNA-directed RNA polymerase, subunit M-transcription elongation factor TFIIS [Enterocytozoon bieneusi H348]|nr:DNA-directed RNA polymerase, subunit M-transcription elongation factor TFIIS [Enterocytozoon bieneusi H348]|eukprot:XP_001828053.1 DNA-directed RNA polymerase, subunit M-transcription elongation factor TFIIS [Enterocytozoon bieneusi H348]
MFCDCGTIIILNDIDTTHICKRCKVLISENTISNYSIIQNKKIINTININEEKVSTFKTKNLCRKCGNNEAFVHTIQLRSADEGQTVFYECTKCGTKEQQNT